VQTDAETGIKNIELELEVALLSVRKISLIMASCRPSQFHKRRLHARSGKAMTCCTWHSCKPPWMPMLLLLLQLAMITGLLTSSARFFQCDRQRYPFIAIQ